MKYVFPAVLEYAEGYGYAVNFPDVSSAVTQGENLCEAIFMAEDALTGTLMSMEDSGREIPSPTSIEDLKLEPKEFYALIKADTDSYRKRLAQENITAGAA